MPLTILKVIPLEGLALLIGVDRFMSEGRALTNIIGNTIATVVIAKSEKAIDMHVYRKVVENNVVITNILITICLLSFVFMTPQLG